MICLFVPFIETKDFKITRPISGSSSSLICSSRKLPRRSDTSPIWVNKSLENFLWGVYFKIGNAEDLISTNPSKKGENYSVELCINTDLGHHGSEFITFDPIRKEFIDVPSNLTPFYIMTEKDGENFKEGASKIYNDLFKLGYISLDDEK